MTDDIGVLNEQITALQETIRGMTDRHLRELALMLESKDVAHQLADRQRETIRMLEAENAGLRRVLEKRGVLA